MENEIYLLSYSYEQSAFHFESLSLALKNNLGSIFDKQGRSQYAPIFASHDEQAIREMTLQIQEVWTDLGRKPLPKEIPEILKIIEAHKDKLIHFDFTGFLQRNF